MGTNYYLKTEEPCPHCGRGGEELHIGKSSFGWCFTLHVYPERGVNTLDDWKVLWEKYAIRSEYDEPLTAQAMYRVVTERSFLGQHYVPFERYSSDAVLGPNNLLRHRISPGWCIGHGEGTWDYMIGEFS